MIESRNVTAERVRNKRNFRQEDEKKKLLCNVARNNKVNTGVT